MNERLREKLHKRVNDYQVKAGKNGKAKLCVAAEIHPSTLDNILGNRSETPTPRTDVIFRLCKALEFTEEEALKIANECSSRAKRTA